MDPKDNGPRWVLALTSVVSFMVSLDSQVVATALPVIRVHLHASLAALEWTVNAYTLSFAVLLLTGAAVGERLGRRRMLAAGVGLFTAASAACALAPNAGALIAARAVQGAGAALMLPLALALLSASLPAATTSLGPRHLQLRDRDRGAGRPGRGRRGDPGPGLAVDLLAQRADRRGPDPADPDPDDRHRRHPRQAGSGRPAPGHRRRARPRLGSGPRQQHRLGQPRDQ